MNLLVLTFLSTASAKDLDKRIGVGLDNWLSDSVSISARYGLPLPNNLYEAQLEGLLGFSTSPTNPNKFLIGARALYAVVVEDNKNLLITGALAGMNIDGLAALRLQPGLEAQFFLMGLDNLSLSAGMGVNFDLGTGNTKVELSGSALGGFHYWF